MRTPGRRDPRNEREAHDTIFIGRRYTAPTPRTVRSPWPPVFVAFALLFAAIGGRK